MRCRGGRLGMSEGANDMSGGHAGEKARDSAYQHTREKQKQFQCRGYKKAVLVSAGRIGETHPSSRLGDK
eukprot:1147674-Amorphochlora_amoeboformis.AAC.2